MDYFMLMATLLRELLMQNLIQLDNSVKTKHCSIMDVNSHQIVNSAKLAVSS